MKNFRLLLAAIITLFLLQGCATHWGMMSGNASLSSDNFTMLKIATGTASTTKIIGIGGLGKDALVLSAKKDLLLNNPLKKGQALANVTVDFKTSIIFFIVTQKVTVTADIIEFNE